MLLPRALQLPHLVDGGGACVLAGWLWRRWPGGPSFATGCGVVGCVGRVALLVWWREWPLRRWAARRVRVLVERFCDEEGRVFEHL